MLLTLIGSRDLVIDLVSSSTPSRSWCGLRIPTVQRDSTVGFRVAVDRG